MTERIDNTEELYCYKITYETGEVVYYVDVSMADAVRSAEEIEGVKTAEYVGKGGIGS